jgi:hypothetical protein
MCLIKTVFILSCSGTVTRAKCLQKAPIKGPRFIERKNRFLITSYQPLLPYLPELLWSFGQRDLPLVTGRSAEGAGHA